MTQVEGGGDLYLEEGVAHAKPWGGREGGLCAWNSEAHEGVRGDGWGRGQARRGSWDKSWVEAHLGESGWPRLEGAVWFLWEEEAAAQGYLLDHHHPSSLISDLVPPHPGPLQGWAIRVLCH